jgi:hypothetical protein
MKKFIQTSIFLLIVQFAFGQSVTISPTGDDIILTKYGSIPVVLGKRANGTSSAPTPVGNGSNLLYLSGTGYNGTSFTTDRATISLRATQTWTSTANGTQIAFTTTPNGTTNDLERMVIANDGKVGIGTSAPATRLHIHEPNAGSSGSFQLTNADAGATVSDGLHFGLNPSGLFSFGASIINKENSFLALGTNNNSTQLFLDQSGNVAVGTLLAQDAKLTIEANSTCCGGIPYSTLTLKESEADGSRLRFTNTNSATDSRFWDIYGSPAINGGEANATMSLFYSTATGTGNNVMNLKGNGRVGIGTGSPADQLHLSNLSGTGDVYTRISSNAGLTGLRLQNNGGDWTMYTNEFNRLFFGYSTNNFASTSNVLFLEPVGANYNFLPAVSDQVFLGNTSSRFKEIYSVLPLNTSSDRRLKKDITTIKYGLDEVLKLNAVSYHWRNNSDSKLHLGFIAQEVDKIIPEIVSKSNLSDEEFEKIAKKGTLPSDTYGMEYTGLIPVLVKAIQEQQQMIDDKSLKINQLEEKLKRMNDLESRLTAIEVSLNKPTQEVKSDRK